MVEIKELTESDINRKVVYVPSIGRSEEGRITSWNAYYVFVDYTNVGRGVATPPMQLTFI